MSEERKRIPEFEIIRAISILMLLIHHSGLYALNFFGGTLEFLSPYFEGFLLGSFFLIAGYFMEISLGKSGGDLAGFFFSRFIRIYPPYLAALILFVFVLGITLKTRSDWLVYLGAVQFIFAPEFVKPMITLWYIGAIILYYLLFPVLRWLAPGTRGLTALTLVVFLCGYLMHEYTGLFDARFFKYYFVFFTGLILARAEDSSRILSARGIVVKGACAVFGVWIFSLVAKNESNQSSLPYVVASFLFIVTSFVFLYSLAAKPGMQSPWKWVTAISYASFFVYLFHRPFWTIFEGFMPVLDLRDRILFRLLPASVLVLPACYFLQRLYDSILGAATRKLSR